MLINIIKFFEITQKSEENNAKKRQQIFGDVVYFPDSLELVRDNQTHTLTPIPSKILDVLISRQGRLVSREDLVEAAWPDGRIVTDATFYQNIRRLRVILGDTTEPRRYITNPHSKYLMLQTPITEIGLSTPLSKTVKGLLAIIFVNVVLLVLWLNVGTSYQRYGDTAITNIKGQTKRAAASPDQSVVVFSHKEFNGWWNLKAKKLNSEKYVNLVEGKQGVYNVEPDFSPSGKRLSWVMTDWGANCEIMVADFDSKKMALSGITSVQNCTGRYAGRSPQWKTEDTLFVALPQGDNEPDVIYEVDLNTQKRTKLTTTDGVGVGDYALFYNSDNGKLAHLRQLNSYDAEAVLMMYDTKLKTDTILKKYSSAQYSIAWFDETRLLVKGDQGFEVVSLDGRTELIQDARIAEEDYVFSMGDKQFGFVRGPLYSADINYIDLTTGTQNLSKFSSTSHELRVVIAKEVEEIAFSSKRNGHYQIFITVDQVPVQVTHFTSPVIFFDLAISPYSRYVTFESGGYLYLVDASGEELYKTKAAISGISFSENGDSLFFGTETRNGAVIRHLNIISLKESIITNGFMPKAVQDGVYFFRLNKDTLAPVLYKRNWAGEETVFFESPFRIVDSTSFDIIGNQLLYVKNIKGQRMLVGQNLITKEVKEISSLRTTKFSINKDMTVLVTNPKGVVQNNLAAFRLRVSE